MASDAEAQRLALTLHELATGVQKGFATIDEYEEKDGILRAKITYRKSTINLRVALPPKG